MCCFNVSTFLVVFRGLTYLLATHHLCMFFLCILINMVEINTCMQYMVLIKPICFLKFQHTHQKLQFENHMIEWSLRSSSKKKEKNKVPHQYPLVTVCYSKCPPPTLSKQSHMNKKKNNIQILHRF